MKSLRFIRHTKRRIRQTRRRFLLVSVLLSLGCVWRLYPTCDTATPASDTIVSSTPSPSQGTSALTVVVLTHSRASSLLRLLHSLREADYDGDRVDLHVWVDRSVPSTLWQKLWRQGTVDVEVVRTSGEFLWEWGEKVVHVWDRHVGIWGQWIDTWRPKDDESAVLLEDDLEVSPSYYRWLRKAKSMYGDREDIFGYTLQRGTLRANQTGFGRRKLNVDKNEKAFLYPLVGSWGYAPKAATWRQFQDWFHDRSCRDFKPYVDGLIPTKWYMKQEKKKSMWTMWHIRYAWEHTLYTVYFNLNGTLAANWREPGLHFKTGGRGRSGVVGERDFELVGRNVEIVLPQEPVKLAWNGTYWRRDGRMRGT